MIIKNADVYTQDNVFVKGDVVVDNGTFTKVLDVHNYVGDEVVDATGLKMIPGLVDIHFHGCKGADMCDGTKEALDIISLYEASVGVTSICPATMTIAKEELVEVMKNAGEYSYNGGAHLVGINMEGPFISPQKKGAQAAENIMHCNYEYFCELQKAAHDLIKIVDIAPEEPGAMDFIDKVKDNVVVSIAHTAADYDCASRAMKLGAHHVTHLYNAMQPFGHRAPGLIGAAMDDPECMVELICDGYHIHPSAIRAAFRMFGPERVILISDSMRATGMENGTYELGGQEVTVKDRKAVLKDGTLAGSATNLYGCMCKAVEFGIPLEQAIMAATANPARSIGIFDRVGSIRIGKQADLLLVSENLELKRVI